MSGEDLWGDTLPYCSEYSDSQVYGQLDSAGGQELFTRCPQELVDIIGAYVPQRDLPSFSLVSKSCYAAGIRNLYAHATLQAHLFRVTSPNVLREELVPISLLLPPSTTHTPLADKDADQTSSSEKIEWTGCPTLRRLVRNKVHQAAIRSLTIHSYPFSANARACFLSLVQYICNNAPNVRHINHAYFPTKPVRPPDIPNSWRESLTSITTRHVCWWILRAVKGARLRKLVLIHCSTSLATNMMNWHRNGAFDGASLKELHYLWHEWDDKMSELRFDWIATVFPNLMALNISICGCWVDAGASNEEYLKAFCDLVSNLPHLESITIGELEENSAEAELEFIHPLYSAQPTLRQITFSWKISASAKVADFVAWEESPRSEAVWRLTVPVQRTEKASWTPDPTNAARFEWWFSTFGLPHIARRQMERLWRPHLFSEEHKSFIQARNRTWKDIPSEEILYAYMFELIKADLIENKMWDDAFARGARGGW